jgi:hypothetical protein
MKLERDCELVMPLTLTVMQVLLLRRVVTSEEIEAALVNHVVVLVMLQ